MSGVDYISRFDASDFPTKFAAQIKDFDVGDLVDKKNARRYDDCLSYTMVASKKVRRLGRRWSRVDRGRQGLQLHG